MPPRFRGGEARKAGMRVLRGRDDGAVASVCRSALDANVNASRRWTGRVREWRPGDVLARGAWHWPVLVAWMALWFAVEARRGGMSWHFSARGAHLLWSGGTHGGLHLFASDPRLQSGPLSFVLAQPLTWIGPHEGLVAAQVAMTLLGLIVIAAVERAAFALNATSSVTDAQIRRTVLLGAAVLIPMWQLTGVGYAHFDDVLALTFAALAVWAVVRQRPVLVGACLGLSIDSKPWAAAFLPLLFALPRGARRALPLALGLTAVAWLPFFMVDTHSTNALTFTIANARDSALRAVGVASPRTPRWDRWAQVGAGCLFGGLAVWRRQWAGVLLIGVCARIALEPNDYAYYFTGLVLGAWCWDLLTVRDRGPQPLATLSVMVLVFALPSLRISAQFDGQLKLWTVIAATAAVLLGPQRSAAAGADGPNDGRRFGGVTGTVPTLQTPPLPLTQLSDRGRRSAGEPERVGQM